MSSEQRYHVAAAQLELVSDWTVRLGSSFVFFV